MPTKLRTVYLVREASQAAVNADSKPQAWIETTARGEIVYGVKVSAGTLAAARIQAETEFDKLRAHVEALAAKGEET